MMSDLAHGQGEWKNMQEIIRRTFQQVLEKQADQDSRIASLSGEVTKLKTELNHRPTWEDVEGMLKLQQHHMKQASFTNNTAGSSLHHHHHGSLPADIHDMKIQIAQLQSDFERKVSIQSLQTMLSRKVDKADFQFVKESGDKLASRTEDIAKLKLDIVDIRSQIDNLQEEFDSFSRAAGIKNSVMDISVVKVQLEALFRRVHEQMYSIDDVNNLLKQKIDRSDVDNQLTKKLDISVFALSTARVEEILEEHEQSITSLRISAKDPNVFASEFLSHRTLPASALQPQPRSTSRTRSSSATAAAGGSSDSNGNANNEKGELRIGIRERRLESVITALWSKLSAVLKEYKAVRHDLAATQQQFATLQKDLTQVAAAEKVELLAVVVEEQRIRIDSIVQGSTKIYPIYKELRRIEDAQREVAEYLHLPQTESLPTQLREVTTLIEDQSRRLMDLAKIVTTEQRPKLDTSLAKLDVLEARLETCLVDRERIGYLMDTVDLTHTRYENLRSIATSLSELWSLVVSHDGTNTTSHHHHDTAEEQDSKGTASSSTIANRLQKVEKASMTAERDRVDLRRRLEKLKEAVAAYSQSLDRQPIRLRRSYGGSNLSIGGLEVERESDRGSSKDPLDSPNNKERQQFRMSDMVVDDNSSHEQKSNKSAPLHRTGVDFEAALSQLFSSIEEVQMPIRASQSSPVMQQYHREHLQQEDTESQQQPQMMMSLSISDVDRRLAELQQEKVRLRRLLVDRV